MLRKSFTAPVWVLLGMALVAAVWSVFAVYTLDRFLDPPGVRNTSVFSYLRVFLLPAILLIEMAMYWLVRHRNIYRRDSWGHVLMFLGAYLVWILWMVVVDLLWLLHDVRPGLVRYQRWMRTGIFWGMLIVAHVFFARVMIRSMSRTPLTEEPKDEGNILDDVVL